MISSITLTLILLISISSLLIIIPLIILLTSLRLALSRFHHARNDHGIVHFDSKESVILPYDPCVSITPDLYSSTAVTTSVKNSPGDLRRRSLTTEYFQTVLGLEKREVSPEVGHEPAEEDASNSPSCDKRRQMLAAIERTYKSREKNNSYRFKMPKVRSSGQDAIRMWNNLSAEIASAIQNVKKSISRHNSVSSVKSVSSISEEGFQEDSDGEIETSRDVSTTTASPIVATKTASVTVFVDEDIVPCNSESGEERSRAHKTRTSSVPTKKGASPEQDRLKPKEGGLSRRLNAGGTGTGSGSNRTSIKRKGRSFLSSLEDMLQKSAARKAAACLRRDAAVSIQLEDATESEENDTVIVNMKHTDVIYSS